MFNPLIVAPAIRKPGSSDFDLRRWIPRLRPRRMTTIGIYCLSVSFVFADHQPARQAVQSYNEGVKLYNQGQFRAAIGPIEQAISRDPDFAGAHMLRGACRYQLKAFENALIDLNQALRLDPTSAEARSLRGNVYYELDQWDQAVEDFSKVLAKDSSHASALFGRGLIRLRRDDYAGAKQDFRRFLSVKPDDPIAPELRKLLSSLSGGWEDAASSGEAASAKPTSRRSSAARASQAAKAFTESLTVGSRDLSEEFGRKAIRGEAGEAVGDIHTVVQPQ